MHEIRIRRIRRNPETRRQVDKDESEATEVSAMKSELLSIISPKST